MHLFNKENIWSNPILHTSTIILQTELFPKKRREKIQGEILQSSFQLESNSVSSNPTREKIQGENFHLHTSSNPTVFPVILHTIQHSYKNYSVSTCNPATPSNSTYRINLYHKKYYNYKAHPVQTNTRHLPVTAPVHQSIPKRQPASHPHSSYNSSQDTPKTSCPRTIQGYNSSPGHSPKTTCIPGIQDRTVS